MSNHFSKASFLIKCSNEQAVLAQEAISFITEATEEEGEELLSKPQSDYNVLEKLILSMLELHPEFNMEEPTFTVPNSASENYSLELATEVVDGGLCVSHDETIDLNHAIAVTQAILSTFNLPQMVSISAAYVCDKAQVDSFGGVMVVVTKDSSHCLDSYQFAQSMQDSHSAGLQHALCKVTFYHGEHSYDSRYLLSCTTSEKPADVAFALLSGLTEAEPNVDRFVCLSEEDNSGVSLASVEELTAYEFSMFSKVIPLLGTLSQTEA